MFFKEPHVIPSLNSVSLLTKTTTQKTSRTSSQTTTSTLQDHENHETEPLRTMIMINMIPHLVNTHSFKELNKVLEYTNSE